MSLAILIGITEFFFEMGNATAHWLFALKYWIIAREVPKLFQEQQITYSERIYTTIKVVGFVINFLPCVVLAYYRARLTMENGGTGSASD